MGSYPLDNEGNQAASVLAGYIEVTERQRTTSPAGSMFVPLPHESDRESISDMDTQEEGGETPTLDERTDTASEAGSKGKGVPEEGTVVVTEAGTGLRLVLATTSPTYTPPPMGGLHSGLRMWHARHTLPHPHPRPGAGHRE